MAMLHKFALAFKTKTIEFFAEEDEEDDGEDSPAAVDSALEEVITGQRVVVLKPDPPLPKPDPHTLLAAAFAAISSFQASYLHLQTAHSPFLPEELRAADRSAVSHLRRLSDLKHSGYQTPGTAPPVLPLSSHLEDQVRENQTLLRSFDAVVNRLQADIDRKDGEAAALEQRLQDLEAVNSKLAERLERACTPPEEKVEALLTVGVFDSVLRDTCRLTHRFTQILMDLMKKSGWDLGSAANCIHPNVNYSKPRHCRYAILSYVCLRMFGGFDSYDFCCCERDGIQLDDIDITIRRNDSLQQFIEHSALDALELLRVSPSCEFAQFCEKKYGELLHPGMESSFFNLSEEAQGESSLGLFRPSNPLYEPFVSMASSMWILHKLAWAYDPAVEIFQVARGTEFSMVFMENVIRKVDKFGVDCWRTSQLKVGFTVVPGFRVGKTVVQCRVYLDGLEKSL